MAIIEMAVVVGRVIRGQTSHYNATTPLNNFLLSTMGTAIIVLFVARLADRVAATAVRPGLGLSLLGMLAAWAP